jgi:hypothetical protein
LYEHEPKPVDSRLAELHVRAFLSDGLAVDNRLPSPVSIPPSFLKYHSGNP